MAFLFLIFIFFLAFSITNYRTGFKCQRIIHTCMYISTWGGGHVFSTGGESRGKLRNQVYGVGDMGLLREEGAR